LGSEGIVEHSAKKGTQYDARTDWIANRNNAEYSMGRTRMFPKSMWSFSTVPNLEFNSIGARGIGKIGITGTPAMIANAVHHVTDKRMRQLPIRSEDLLS
jgi:xanthine dehydrogenase YagR molybdenum-binding subunit